MQTIGEPEIDSCSVSIPIEKVEIIEPNLLSSRDAVFRNTGQIDEGYKLKDKSLSLQMGPGIKNSISINGRYNRQDGVKEYIVFGLSSKMLKQRYFEGMKESNLSNMYDLLMSQKIVSFPFSVLMTDATVTDVDIKWDGLYTGKPIELLKAIKEAAAFTQNRGEGVRPFYEKDNLGLEFSVRTTTAYARAPYFKIYHKGIEMSGKSAEFTGCYINKNKLDDLWRIETTIKNKAHFKRHGILNNTLGNVLSIQSEKKRSILKSHFQAHIEGGIKKIVNPRECLGPTDTVLLHLINQAVCSGDFLDVVIEKAIRCIDDRVARSRMKSRLYSICSGDRVMSVEKTLTGADVEGAEEFCRGFCLAA